ncbi:nucleotide exchange factor GrpE [Simkania sp.]|uniref:nucleotide exchange factor GrpE n=1 Tax=Simkania sp. TaxID=34094 RepID=UPI003B52FBFD
MDPESQGEKQSEAQEDKPQEEQLPTSEELQFELRNQQEKNLRLLAEMENARKRMQKDKHDTTRFAVENVIEEFLSPLDNFENAFSFTQQASEEVQNWAKGFEMILTQFKDVLANHNVTPFSSEGNHFDPHLHEVIEIEETEKHEEGTVIQEFVRGYKCGERILRPAKVKVAKKPVKESEETPVNEEEKQSEGEH